MTTQAETIQSLRRTLSGYTLEANPVEYATIQFNIGLALAESHDGDRESNLRTAIAAHAEALKVFGATNYPLLRGRVLTALGSAERDLGLGQIARDRFEEATHVLSGIDAPAEVGAAYNNLGLAETDLSHVDLAILAFDRALQEFSDDRYRRQRATTLVNRGLARSRMGSETDLETAIDDYRAAATLVEPTEASYVYALAHHSLGIALLGLPGSRQEHLSEAIRSLDTSLTVFTSLSYPFQHALTKNNLGVAYEEIAPHDVTSQRRALARFEEAMMLLDPRIHPEQWQEINSNLTRVLATLEELAPMTRVEHFGHLLASISPPERLDFLRFRLRSLLSMPEPHRSESLLMLDRVICDLPPPALTSITRTWLEVLMEQPHDHLEVGLRARQSTHEELEGEQLQAALLAIEAALGDLEIIQRVRVRDMLTELGYERPEPE